jgi:hypothetical protein
MKLILQATTLGALMNCAFAVTHAVLPGESIQAKVDLAQPGDIVAIFGGAYPGDITINKAIRLVEVDGEDVTITGNVTWNGVTNAPPFEGFTVGSSGKGILITNTTGIVLKNIDARPGSGVTANGLSKVGITGGFYSQISQNGGELTTTRTQVAGNFTTTVNTDKTSAYRTTVDGDARWNSKKSWFGYSKARSFDFSGVNSSVVIVGSEIDHQLLYGDGIGLHGSNNKYQIMNCVVKNVKYLHWWGVDAIRGSGIRIGSGNTAKIFNNYIHLWTSHDDAIFDSGEGVRSDVEACQIFNNIIVGGQCSISAPYGAMVRNNAVSPTRQISRGGVIPIDLIHADPLFVVGAAPELQPTSPCINAGISDPIFNDLDGTRNDIGPGGGSFFDSEGWTTNKPVVISFDLAPQQLLKGVDTQVTLSNGQAVAQP